MNEGYQIVMYYNCVVCISNFRCEDVIYSARCGHVFHEKCFQRLLTYSFSCPICRTECRTDARRLYFSISNNDTIDEDVLYVGTLKLELSQKETQIRDLEIKVENMTHNHDEEILKLEEKFKKEKEKSAEIAVKLKRESAAAKSKLNMAHQNLKVCQTENKRLIESNRELLRKISCFENNHQNQSTGATNKKIKDATSHLTKKTKTPRVMVPSSSTSLSFGSPSNQPSRKSKRIMVKHTGGVNVVEVTPSIGRIKPTQKVPVKRLVAKTPREQPNYSRQVVETVSRMRVRNVNGELRPLRTICVKPSFRFIS